MQSPTDVTLLSEGAISRLHCRQEGSGNKLQPSELKCIRDCILDSSQSLFVESLVPGLWQNWRVVEPLEGGAQQKEVRSLGVSCWRCYWDPALSCFSLLLWMLWRDPHSHYAVFLWSVLTQALSSGTGDEGLGSHEPIQVYKYFV